MKILLKAILVLGTAMPIQHPTIPSQSVPANPNKQYMLSEVLNNVQKKIETKKIPVLMFHKFGWNEDRYTLSPDSFRMILENLHSNDYYLVNLNQFSSGDFSKIPTGKKPILLTFDDAGEGQFEYQSDSLINPNSAVGILEYFTSLHKDLGKGGVFFISYSDDKHNFRTPFIEEGLFEKKTQFLINNGYDIGWHTPYHTNNSNATISDIREQKIILDALIYKSIGESRFKKILRAYAHPFGEIPKDSTVREYLNKQYDLLMNAWGGNSIHPLSRKFDPKQIPRIETHTNNINSIISNPENYEISDLDSIYYSYKFIDLHNISVEPKGFDKAPNKEEFFNEAPIERGVF